MLNKQFSIAVKSCWNIILSQDAKVKPHFFSALFLDVLIVLMSVSAPVLLKVLIDALNTKETVSKVVILGLAYGFTWLFAELLLRLRGVISAIMAERLKNEATRRFCKNLIFKLNLKSEEMHGGIFAAKLNQTNLSLPLFVDGLASQITPLIVRLILSVSMLTQFAPPIYSILLFTTIAAFIAISFLSYKKIGERQQESNTHSQAAHWRILDALKNKPVTIAHANEDNEYNRIQSTILKSSKSTIGTIGFSQTINAVQVGILGVGLIAITVFSALDVDAGAITLGGFVQINAYVIQFIIPISYVGMILSGVKRASVTISENSEHLTTPKLTLEASDNDLLVSPPSITLNQISVVSPSGRNLLRNINLRIDSGSSLAIVGTSGAGKSTIAKAILGLVEITSGEILIDSRKMSADTAKRFRKATGYVPQDPLLFDRSIWDNIFDNEAFNAADEARVLEISGISGNAESLKARNSNALSGGEKQRVSFARAVARNPRVMIFDEPASSLDKETKQIISTSIFSILESITRIVITHDLEEASKADKIAVIENGEIIESGSHAELLRAGGWYSNHWRRSLALIDKTHAST